MAITIEHLTNNLKWFAEKYCKDKTVYQNLDFLSDLCFVVGAGPVLTISQKPRRMIGADIGVITRPVEQVDPVATERDALEDVVRAFIGAAYPVATEIHERGYNWSEAYLDEALSEAKKLLEGEGQ